MKTLASMVLVFLGLILLAEYSEAQVQFAIGLRTGLNFSNVSYDPELYAGTTVTKSGSTGFAVGAVAELAFANMFAAEVEPRFIQKGNKFEQGAAKQTISVNELELPIHFKVKFPVGGVVKPYVLVGPNIAFVMSANAKLEGTPNAGETDIKSTTSSTDFGLDFGGGAEIKVASKVAITGDVRYSLGLSNLNSDPQSPNQSAKARGFQVLAGVLFFL